MKALSELIQSAYAALPEAALARWASIFFSLSVLTILISIAASQAFLAIAGLVFGLHVLFDRPAPQVGREDRRTVFPPVKLPLAMFCAFTIISVFWAAYPTPGWLSVRKLVLFLIWLFAVNLVFGIKHLQLLYWGLFVESALAGLVAAGQFVNQYRAAHPGRIYYEMTLVRIHGFMGHWMNFSGQQMLVFVALLAFLLLVPRGVRGPASGTREDASPGGVAPGPSEPRAPKPDSQVRGWIVLAIVGASIGLSLTRGVWLACFVAGIYLVARSRPRYLWTLPVFLLVGYFAAPTLLRQRVRILLHPTTDPALSIRFEMWQVALRMIQKHPLVGVGPNNIEQVYTLYLPLGKSLQIGYRDHMHNNFLQFGAERGLPCLVAWVWLMGALAWHSARIRRRLSREHRPTWIADAAVAAWLAFIVEGFFEFNFGTSPVLMLFLFVTSTPFVLERFELSVNGQSKV